MEQVSKEQPWPHGRAMGESFPIVGHAVLNWHYDGLDHEINHTRFAVSRTLDSSHDVILCNDYISKTDSLLSEEDWRVKPATERKTRARRRGVRGKRRIFWCF
jgi:hypothetical protein